MKTPFVIALCAGLILSGAAQAGEININQRFSGTAHPTMVDTNGDGLFAGVGTYHLKGSPGKATMMAFVEFGAIEPAGIPGCELRGELVQETFVETFDDLSMIFFAATSGFNCVNIATFEIWGGLEGIVTGGTGRFEGATGSWKIEAEIFPAGPGVTGTFKGTVVVPD